MDVSRYFRIYQMGSGKWAYEPHWQVARGLAGYGGFSSRREASSDAMKYWNTATQTVREYYHSLYAQS